MYLVVSTAVLEIRPGAKMSPTQFTSKSTVIVID